MLRQLLAISSWLLACASGVGATSPDATTSAGADAAADGFAVADAAPDANADAAVWDARVADARSADASPADPLIDDVEDGDGWIRAVAGRSGAWFAFNDGTAGGVQMPPATADFAPVAGGPAQSRFCAHTSGHGFVSWGAGMGFDLATPPVPDGGTTMRGSFDASAYTGIAFAARGNVPVRALVVVPAVVPQSEGGTCPDTAMCSDAHGLSIALTTSWTPYMLPFSQLAQAGWGRPAAFDPAHLLGVQFQTAENVTFDVSVDDVHFY